MWLPFISKINKLEKERNDNIREMTQLAQHILRKRGKFILNSLGSGDNTYNVNGRLFKFNEFGHKYCGFFIDNKRYPLKEFVEEVQRYW